MSSPYSNPTQVPPSMPQPQFPPLPNQQPFSAETNPNAFQPPSYPDQQVPPPPVYKPPQQIQPIPTAPAFSTATDYGFQGGFQPRQAGQVPAASPIQQHQFTNLSNNGVVYTTQTTRPVHVVCFYLFYFRSRSQIVMGMNGLRFVTKFKK